MLESMNILFVCRKLKSNSILLKYFVIYHYTSIWTICKILIWLVWGGWDQTNVPASLCCIKEVHRSRKVIVPLQLSIIFCKTKFDSWLETYLFKSFTLRSCFFYKIEMRRYYWIQGYNLRLFYLKMSINLVFNDWKCQLTLYFTTEKFQLTLYFTTEKCQLLLNFTTEKC